MTRDTPKKAVAIFLTDYSLQHKERFGNFADQSARALKAGGNDRPVKVFDTIKSEFPTEDELVNDIKAIWITGSASDAFADVEWINKLVEYIQWITKSHPEVPLIGICFGHQVIGRALGAKVGRNPSGWEYGVHEIKVNTDDEDVKELFSPLGQSFGIEEVHQDVVLTLPEGCKNIGSTEKTQHQGFYKKNHLLTFQGHPEFTNDFMSAHIVGMKQKHTELSEEFYEDAERRVVMPHNGSQLSEIIVKFIESAETEN